MRKHLLTLSGLALFLLAVHPAHAISLKQESLVRDENITLGDVFEGLDDNHKKILGNSPKPGEQIVLNARTLMRIAIAMELPWRPTTALDQVIIKRSGVVIDEGAIEQALRDHLTKEGIDGQYDLAIQTGLSSIVLPETLDPSVKITRFNLRQDGRSFEATIAAPDSATPAVTRQITGMIERITSVPVLKDAITKGDIIGKNDIQYIDLPARSVKPDTILTEENLIGATPRRMLAAGEPVKAGDIEAPRMVERGQSVTLIFSAGPLNLTARGKALENGTQGDVIRVLNTSSNKTIDGVVTASQEVSVSAL
jgi:flagella basal body P-ring formation protein FlgA